MQLEVGLLSEHVASIAAMRHAPRARPAERAEVDADAGEVAVEPVEAGEQREPRLVAGSPSSVASALGDELGGQRAVAE